MLNRISYSTSLMRQLFVSIMMLTCASLANAQDIRVAFFDGQRVLNESLPAKVATAKIKQEFSKREKELDDLNEHLRASVRKFEKEAPSLTELERTRRQRELADLDQDFNRKQRIFSEDLGQRKQEELNILAERAQKVVRQIAELEKIDLVVQDAVFFNPRIDITDKVLKALAK